MGGEDLEMWISALSDAELLVSEVKVVAYTYIGSALTWSIYRDGTIGRAKDDLKTRVDALDKQLANQLVAMHIFRLTKLSSHKPLQQYPLFHSILASSMIS